MEDNSGQLADIATDNILAREVEALNSQLAHKDDVIKMKDERIRNLEGGIGWLRSEYSKKDAQLSQFLLPAPKKSFWDKIFRGNITNIG